jgi:peptide deformylase
MKSTTKQPFTAEERALIGDSAEAGPLRVLKIDDPGDAARLRRKAVPLPVEVLATSVYSVLKARMLDTVRDPRNPGVGIAAPQVGVSRQLIAVERHDRPEPVFEFYVNPRIERSSGAMVFGSEGCLSVPDRSERVGRACAITVSYWDETAGVRQEEEIEGFTAVIFQHEIDHLNGILYIDRV